MPAFSLKLEVLAPLSAQQQPLYHSRILMSKFKILLSVCPSWCSLRYMIRHGLKISTKEKTVSFKHKIKALTFEKDFLKKKWGSRDMDFARYTEKELRRSHRAFGHA